MIVICGIPSEPPVEMVVDAAVRAGVDHVVVNQRMLADHDLVLDVGRGVDRADAAIGGVLRTGTVDLDLGAVSGVYIRMTDARSLPENRGRRSDRVERSLAANLAFQEWADVAPCRVANRTAPMTTNASKPFQAQLIERSGFATPTTLVTDDPEEVRAFAATHGPLIYKSISSVRSIVRALDPADDLEAIRHLPTQFQVQEHGTDVRVHVVGTSALATRVTTGAVDYRYASRDGVSATLEPTELPADVERGCLALAAALDLPFSGIDLLQRHDGTWVCFEVNPSPGFSYFEAETGQPISDTLVAWLHGVDPGASGARAPIAAAHPMM